MSPDQYPETKKLDTTFKLFLKDLFFEYNQNFNEFSFCFDNNKIIAISYEGDNNTLYLHNSGVFLISNSIDTLHYHLQNSFVDMNTRNNFKNYLVNNGTDTTKSFDIANSDEVLELMKIHKVGNMMHAYNKKFEVENSFLKSLLNEDFLIRTENISNIKLISFFLTKHEEFKDNPKFKFTDNDKIIEFLEVKHIESDLNFDKLIDFFKVKNFKILNTIGLK